MLESKEFCFQKVDEICVARDSEFAPFFMLRYPEKYSHLLSNPYKNLVLPRSHIN